MARTHRAKLEPVAPTPPLKAWQSMVKQRRVKVLVNHPHHYTVAVGMTMVTAAIHFDWILVVGFWVYAVFENVFTLEVT